MSAHATSAIKPPATKTPLDYMAEGYWQDFLAQRAIAGGMAYDESLQECQWDESLASLQRIDILLSQIRRDIIKSDKLNETAVLADERYCNLFILLAFYAGRVLARQWHYSPNWYGQFELAKRYPDLPIVEDDFYQHMAVVYCNNAELSNRALSSLFFALEPIGQRLFGNIDRQFTAVQGGQVASGLYQAVLERLPNTASHKGLAVKSSDNRNSITNNLSFKDSITVTNNRVDSVTDINSQTDSSVNNKINTAYDTDSANNHNAPQLIAEPSLVKESVITDAGAIKPEVIQPATSGSNLQKMDPQQAGINSKPIAPTPEMFTQLLDELKSIEVAQTNGNEDYNQACKTLDQFERHIARQHTARSEVKFSPDHQQQRQQALVKLQDAASVGHTGALLRLAMYELLGEGLVATDRNTVINIDNNTDKKIGKEAGIELVKQAANANDSRGQRLLSRLYYRGFGVTQDIQSGKHWLEQAAKNGHSEAATLVAEWQQAERLMTTRQQDQHSTKRYQLLIIIVIIAAVALIIFV